MHGSYFNFLRRGGVVYREKDGVAEGLLGRLSSRRNIVAELSVAPLRHAEKQYPCLSRSCNLRERSSGREPM